MRRVGYAAAVLAVITLGCSQAGRDRLKHWFFEIPGETGEVAATSEQTAPMNLETPQLVLAESKYQSVHRPYVTRQCRSCHDAAKQMAVREDMSDACASCHEPFFDEDQVEHSPVADGECQGCHDLHRSERPFLLTTSEAELCAECHDAPEDLSEEFHGGEGVENCSKCHDPHFGESPYIKPKAST